MLDHITAPPLASQESQICFYRGFPSKQALNKNMY